jgi:uncharacterized protein HemX
MNKYSYIAILLAIVVGFVAGYLVLGNLSNEAQLDLIKQYEVRLKQKEDSSKQVIKKLNKDLIHLNKQLKADSVKIQYLLNKIQQDKIKTEQIRKKISKLTPNEAKSWILDRYK